MRLLPPDERGLRRALELASDAAAFASPNPTVGCVLLQSETGAVLGEGAHFYENFDHAEIAALKQARAAGHDLHGATACVTLEPCVHHGRTGPCSDALITAGISRCVVATFDPNPLVRGEGLARMSAAGIEVLVGDPGRAYLPRDRCTEVAAYEVPVPRALEDADVKHTTVWQLR